MHERTQLDLTRMVPMVCASHSAGAQLSNTGRPSTTVRAASKRVAAASVLGGVRESRDRGSRTERSTLSPMELPTAYELDDNPARVDLDIVWGFLSTEAYWGRWRTRDIVEQQVRAAWRVIGAYEQSSGTMVGFARALSDGCALAYLADVFVLPPHRGQGLGMRLVRAMIEDGPGASFLWMLHTADAHGLYAKFRFAPRDDGRYLERRAQPG